VEGNSVFVGAIVAGIDVAVAWTEDGPIESNCIAPMSKDGPRGLAKKSLDIPMSAALAAAGDELEGR